MKRFSRRIVMVSIVILAILAPVGGPRAVRSAPPRWDRGDETLALAQKTIIPPRDRIDLARRLLGVTDIPAPPTVAPPELEIGDRLTFWADNVEADYAFQVEAELVYKTAHVYMFVEVGLNSDESVDLAAVQRSAEAFETIIRPGVHDIFGTEWTPGIDGDPHLYVLHARNLGSWVAAYYDSASEYPVEAVENSNEHEMFYVNLNAMGQAIGTPYYEGTLAHEFQHMVHWYVDENEDGWLNEGLSELAAMLTGYGASGFAAHFLSDPVLQLNAWPEDEDRGAHYGAAFLFAAYFYERYGEAATTTLVRDPANGMVGIDNTLAALGATDPATGEPVTVVDLFADWVIANRVNDPSAGDGRYAYTFPAIQGIPQAAITLDITPRSGPLALDTPQWGANYLRLVGGFAPRRVRVSFTGQPTVSIVPADARSGQYAWWSNRADSSDMRLTRAFDLTGVSRATLDFWMWYHIENLWDYAYVMVSTDGGATWTPLQTGRATTDNPHGNAYGPGYTGESGGWVQETADLTPYAGQNILVRFEYITDDAVTQPGLLLDDVSVPEIGYADDFERGDGGWTSEGWLRMDNTLPQSFVVQLIQTRNPDAPVLRLLGPDDPPQGEWEITVGGEWGDATLVVSGVAPVTTEPAAYRLEVTAVE
jgi:hypothetical protein